MTQPSSAESWRSSTVTCVSTAKSSVKVSLTCRGAAPEGALSSRRQSRRALSETQFESIKSNQLAILAPLANQRSCQSTKTELFRRRSRRVPLVQIVKRIPIRLMKEKMEMIRKSSITTPTPSQSLIKSICSQTSQDFRTI